MKKRLLEMKKILGIKGIKRWKLSPFIDGVTRVVNDFGYKPNFYGGDR